MHTTEQDIDIICSAINKNVKITKKFSIECGSTCSITIDTEDIKCKNMNTCDEYKKGNSKCLVLKELELFS